MDASALAVTMLRWEETKRKLDSIEATIKAAVLNIGKTQNVGNVRATFRNGRKSYDWQGAGEQATQEIITLYTVQPPRPPMPDPVTNWRAVCADAEIEPSFTQGKPSVVVKLV